MRRGLKKVGSEPLKSWGKALQAEGTANAKALRLVLFWHV